MAKSFAIVEIFSRNTFRRGTGLPLFSRSRQTLENPAIDRYHTVNEK
ncbi:MAG: hypothetical protein M3525_02190 [Acidobacteriota bacterium]|jgi:hypothetical protein|nr:hypothetical protein [Acidobacteriota bacterium]